MNRRIGLDPGKHKSAGADYLDGGLNAVFWVYHDSIRVGSRPVFPGLRLVVVEKPQQDGRPISVQTAIDLAWSGAAAAYSFGVPVVEEEPRDWKGSEPKPIHHSRVWDVLTEAERALFPPDTYAEIMAACEKQARWPRRKKKPSSWYPDRFETHNLLCATGLVLTNVGRLRRGT